jgi:phage-related protein
VSKNKTKVAKRIDWFAPVKTPPLSVAARREVGFLSRDLQEGKTLSLPHSRPMPSVDAHVHELRVNDEDQTWRVLYRIDSEAIVVLEVFSKKTPQTPQSVIELCKSRLRRYDAGQINIERSFHESPEN